MLINQLLYIVIGLLWWERVNS